MKKIMFLFFTVALLIPTAIFAKRPLTIGTSFGYLWHPVHAALKSSAEKTAADLGVEILTPGADSIAMQEYNLQDFIDRKVNGILATPITMDSLVPSIEKAVAAGIPVVTVDRKANSDKVLAHVGTDDVEGGRMAARYIIEKLGNKGTVIELEGSQGASPTIDRKKGFDEEISRSKVKILASEGANFYRPAARNVMQKLIKEHPKFDAIFAANDDMILGALDAMRAAGIDPSKKVTVGWDASIEGLASIKQGELSATFDPFPGEQASRALAILVDYIKTKKRPEKAVIYITPQLVTSAK